MENQIIRDKMLGCLYGQAILGAKFGYSAIPRYYIDNLHNKAMYNQKIEWFINQITDEKA